MAQLFGVLAAILSLPVSIATACGLSWLVMSQATVCAAVGCVGWVVFALLALIFYKFVAPLFTFLSVFIGGMIGAVLDSK